MLFSMTYPWEEKNSIRLFQQGQTSVVIPDKATNMSTQTDAEDISLTIVTAYFDIGTFRKDLNTVTRRPESYWQWAKIFGHMRNPLVVYTDSEYFLHLMKSHRARFPDKTKFIWLDKTSTWAFSCNETVRKIFNRTDYPDYIRNNPTAVNYSCVQNAKYEVTQKAALENYFGTDYIAWLDVGLFRHSVNNTNYFTLALPPGFDEFKIAVDQINDLPMDVKLWPIFLKKTVWICGCAFVGRIDTVIRYTEQYKRSVEYLLTRELMNTDEQVVYATYTKEGRRELQPDVDLQLYKKPKNYHAEKAFYIGYIMRHFN